MYIKIKKGRHQSIYNKILQLVPFKQFRFVKGTILLNTSMLYNPDYGDGERDWNKIIGFSLGYGLRKHHKDSFRLAWRSVGNGYIELGAYMYLDGVRYIESLGEFKVVEPKNITFYIGYDNMSDEVTYIINKKKQTFIKYDKTRQIETKWCYKLLSYFGGQGVAQKDIHLIISELIWK